ncbi:MAG: MBL fold metallo-hydrolase [Nitrospina sp.]|nr:MAG: MBL fold metallo-hydrolase [Nitrospina sp.]
MGLKSIGIGIALTASTLMMSPGVQAENFKTVEVLKNIYTVVAPTGANATFITTEAGVILIDTGGSLEHGRAILKEIRKKTDLPVVYIINTHFHKENTWGNPVFASSPTIIAQHQVAKSLAESTEALGIASRLPNLLYESHLELALGGYHLKLFHPGPAHTQGDTFVYLPSWRLIIAGGLVTNRVIPDLSDGYIDEWIKALVQMEDLDAELIVPGHGKVGAKPLTTRSKHYLMELKKYVADQLFEDRTLQQTVEAVRPILLEKYSSWKNSDLIESHIKKAFIEFSAKKGI